MKANFERIRRILYARFAAVGVPYQTAATAATAIARQSIYGLDPNAAQQEAIARCDEIATSYQKAFYLLTSDLNILAATGAEVR